MRNEDKPYAAFESSWSLYQFTRILFRVTNGVACFQRIMDSFIKEEKLAGTFAYPDDITACGMTQAKHYGNLEKFMKAAEKKNIVYNEGKLVFSTTRLSVLGYVVEVDSIGQRTTISSKPPSHSNAYMSTLKDLCQAPTKGVLPHCCW